MRTHGRFSDTKITQENMRTFPALPWDCWAGWPFLIAEEQQGVTVHRAKQLTAQLWLHGASYSLSLFFPHITTCTQGRGRGFSFPFSARCCDCTKSVQRFLAESREESEISSSVTVWVLCSIWGVQKALLLLPWHRCELQVFVCPDLSIRAGMIPEESRCTKPSMMGYCFEFTIWW